MSGDLQLSGLRALVTGGTKGVGEAVVAQLRDAAAKVLTTARSGVDHSADAMFVAADVTSAESCATIAGAVRKRLGGVDIMVHVVGGSSRRLAGSRRSTIADAIRYALSRWDERVDELLEPAVGVGYGTHALPRRHMRRATGNRSWTTSWA